jgi:carbonic anhydrase
VRPAIEELIEPGCWADRPTLVKHAVRANIRAAANHLRHGSQILEELIQNDGLLVVGAEYCLESGVVEFFDGMPDGA